MVSESECTGVNTPPASSAYGFNVLRNSFPVDPKTLAGQRIGAILAIKRKPATGTIQSEVDDLVRVLSYESKNCKVFNLRLEITEFVPWSSFFALTLGAMCGCVEGECRCVMEDPVAFMV